MYETKPPKEKVVLAGVFRQGEDNSLLELRELAEAAGCEVVGEITQTLDRFNSSTYLGKGKVDELKEIITALDADAIVCDDELSPAQIKNLDDILQVKILDRTLVILDIFAARAKSAEGQAQVELAQYKHRLSRLAGLGKSLSRVGGTSGAVGTKGPGEKKLELDRRHIRERISRLNQEIEKIKTDRSVMRAKRERRGEFIVSLAGYTNAGKSTLMNALTGAGVLAKNELFATLDATTRRLNLPDGDWVLLTDTVGFIKKLPTHLVTAFRATIEEVVLSDLILHVVDASAENAAERIKIVYETLDFVGATDTPVITIMNKTDIIPEDFIFPADERAAKIIHASAKTKDGIEQIINEIQKIKG